MHACYLFRIWHPIGSLAGLEILVVLVFSLVGLRVAKIAGGSACIMETISGGLEKEASDVISAHMVR
jgi:hypothetical protein